MSDAQDAATIATNMFNEGRTLDEVRSALYDVFEPYRFYEANGFLYMEDDDGRFPPIRLCEACKE